MFPPTRSQLVIRIHLEVAFGYLNRESSDGRRLLYQAVNFLDTNEIGFTMRTVLEFTGFGGDEARLRASAFY